MELGETNWYGDVSTKRLRNDIYILVGDVAIREGLIKELNAAIVSKQPDMLWSIAKVFYKLFLNYSEIVAINFDGTDTALKLDLNQPINLGKQFDMVFNGGTAEHVFNVWQFFKTTHEVTKPGGIMLHGLPFTGWIDHGFYNFNPTFCWDLASANNYNILSMWYAELTPAKMITIYSREQIAEMAKANQIGKNSGLGFLVQKPMEEKPFQIPLQGYYADALSPEAEEAWKLLR